MSGQELAYMSVAQQGRLIARREVSPVELVREYLERIERWNPALNAYITVCGEQALVQAEEAEREIAAGRYRGPLHGIPYGVKDQLCTRDIRTTVGSRVMADYVPDFNATVIDRLAEAGAILIGKQNLDELGKGGTLDFFFGQPRNPWNPDHSPGGSSSGSGIAVAAGLCSAALGEDTGGSVRGPAASNGIVGLRPTYGRVSRHGGVMYGYTADTIGPLTRTVEDCALLLQVIAGYDSKDPLTTDRPVPDYTKELTGDLRGLRLAVVKELTWTENVHPEVRQAIRDAVDVMTSLGATVEEVSLPLAKYSVPLQMLTSDADVASILLHKWLRTRWYDIDYGIRTRLAAGCLIPASVYIRAMRGRVLVRRQVLDALQQYDALISPTAANPPPRIDASKEKVDTTADMEKRVLLRRMQGYTFSIANVPAISVPCGFASSSLPIALQIAGRPFAEGTVFRVAHAYEQATPWHTQHPDLERTAAAAGVAGGG